MIFSRTVGQLLFGTFTLCGLFVYYCSSMIQRRDFFLVSGVGRGEGGLGGLPLDELLFLGVLGLGGLGVLDDLPLGGFAPATPVNHIKFH